MRFNHNPDVPRKSDQAGHETVCIDDWQLGCQTPHGIIRPMPLHLKVIHKRSSCLKNFLILFRGYSSKIAQTDLAWTLADHLRLALQSVPSDQRIIDGHISSRHVFNKECYVRRSIKESFQKSDFHQRDGRIRHRFLLVCARFHGSMRSRAKRILVREDIIDVVVTSYTMEYVT